MAELAVADLLGAAAGWQQVIGLAVAAQAAVVSELAARRPASSSYPVDDLACALATTSAAANSLVGRAAGLAAHPVLADALRSGVLDARKVDVLLDDVAQLSHADADDVLRAVVADADGLTPGLLRRHARRLVAAIDPEAVRRRAERARRDRCVRLDWAPDSMAWVTALLPAADAVAAFAVVDALADAAASADDDRTVAQRRADAFSDVFATILADGHTPAGVRLPTRGGTAPGVHLTIAATTLAGHDDLPGELAGYGAVPASLARDLARRADRYRLALTDPAGHLLALGERTLPLPPTHRADASGGRTGVASGPEDDAPVEELSARHDRARDLVGEPPPTDGYRPGAALRRFVVARDQTCTFPGCRQPADTCDVDHVDPYDPSRSAVEQTLAANLQPLCRHHHRTKTHHGWRMRRDPRTGDIHTTSPHGFTFTRPATAILLTPTAYEHATNRSSVATRSTNGDDASDAQGVEPPPF
ncbi:HNH endonuclease signature motif containing protein [Cellulomonas alba]|uniref:DUF222 domain-containing protein n=1 Tax=Cellulomonas alba TaxID=3053467 RepID=A0ABT7SEY7_9CELL|nr:HNH endonuclease signature motif containing protein [Cellulomonas alba]MDM7854733.1 DUF222 domain-containing protein [Cellulomonas alba]